MGHLVHSFPTPLPLELGLKGLSLGTLVIRKMPLGNKNFHLKILNRSQHSQVL